MVRAVEMGLVCWLATLVLVDGFVFATPRRAVKDGGERLEAFGGRLVDAGRRVRCGRVCREVGGKIAYLPYCQLCTGVWVGLALAVAVPGPLAGQPFGVLLDGLLYKAVGHIVLELTALPQAATAHLRKLSDHTAMLTEQARRTGEIPGPRENFPHRSTSRPAREAARVEARSG
jgi:hypothetical protein